jgi:hypothetical protein
MAEERSVSRDLAIVFGCFAVVSLAQSAWHVRDAFSVMRWMQDCLTHLIPLAGTYVLVLLAIWRQNRPDESIVKLNLSGSGANDGTIQSNKG